MFDYQAELRRRIDQFSGYLQKMSRRRHREVKQGDCFIIFTEEDESGNSDGDELVESATPVLELAQSGFDDSFNLDTEFLDGGMEINLPEEGWREEFSQRRFIQFCFEQSSFYLDLPLQTLYRPEPEQILRYRKGFYFRRDTIDSEAHRKFIEDFDPLNKDYIYKDEDSAAEDMAFVLFQVWKFPVESRFWVKAAAFKDNSDWEWGVPID